MKNIIAKINYWTVRMLVAAVVVKLSREGIF